MVIQCNGLDTIIICLEDFDSGVKEATAWALGYIARHNKTLAQAIVDAGTYTLLIYSISYLHFINLYINHVIYRSCPTFSLGLTRT